MSTKGGRRPTPKIVFSLWAAFRVASQAILQGRWVQLQFSYLLSQALSGKGRSEDHEGYVNNLWSSMCVSLAGAFSSRRFPKIYDMEVE